MGKAEKEMTPEEIEAKNKFLKSYGYIVNEKGETVPIEHAEPVKPGYVRIR